MTMQSMANSVAETNSLGSSSSHNDESFVEVPIQQPVEETTVVQSNKAITDETKQKDDTTKMTARASICAWWTKLTQKFHRTMTKIVVKCAVHAASHPKVYVAGISFLSLLLVTVGFFTNFRLELDLDKVLAPLGSMPAKHQAWIHSEEGFPDEVRQVVFLMHNDGNNVLNVNAMERVFLGLEAIQETPGYDELCQQGAYVDFEGARTCRLMSPTGFWDHHQLEVFKEQITTGEELRRALSSFQFASGSPVYHDAILGNLEKDATGNLTSAQSYLVTVEIPEKPESNDFEKAVLKRLDRLRRQWLEEDEAANVNIVKMDLMTVYGYELEYFRTIMGDLYLVAVVAFMMCSFVALTFAQFGCGNDEKLKSRTLLGVASVYTIVMSFLTGNGIMFIFGVPFTSITQIIPFVVFGIGLDDTFIITGAYFRTDPQKDTIERIRITMEEVAHSILLTTITTVFAFLLGFLSSLPGVIWLCFYAFTMIFIDFIYQITLFCAFIALDEERVQSNRRDCCFCLKYNEEENSDEGSDDYEVPIAGEPDTDTATKSSADEKTVKRSLPERAMSRYADFLLQPFVKAIVLVMFGAFFGACTYSATLLTQEFQLGDYVADDSYLKDILHSFENYASVVRPIAVYFRNIDQSDPEMQEQMINYVNELEALPQLSGTIDIDMSGYDGAAALSEVKPFCWVRDFHQLQEQFADQAGYEMIKDLSFNEQLDLALSNHIVREVYAQDIMRDEYGNITASRCWLFLSNLDLNDVQDQIDMLYDQRAVGAAQPMNQGQSEWSCFFYDILLFYWEAYSIAIRELIFTIVSGVVPLTVISFLLIPHWSAVCFVTPMILMLYANFLGTLQAFGLHINPLLYICVVVSIGLLVDFLLHILLRYYETSCLKSRNERVKETLETMGASILLGGLTTFLGVVPLCLSTTKIFMTVFLAFLAMVLLGIAHGLILLPVLLSLVGPTTGLIEHNEPDDDEDNNKANGDTRSSTKHSIASTAGSPLQETSQSSLIASTAEGDDSLQGDTSRASNSITQSSSLGNGMFEI